MTSSFDRSYIDFSSLLNSTIPYDVYLSQPYVIIYLIITGVSSFVGVIGNTMTIFTFLFTKALHETRNSFIVNLAAADMLVTGIVMPFSMFGVVAGKAYFDERKLLCSFLATVCAPGCLASMFTICWISCTRYVYICQYGLYKRVFSTRNTCLFIASIWLLCLLVHFPNHVGWGNSKYSVGFQLCTLDMEEFSYSFFYGCFMVVAICVTFFFYFKIYQTVKKSNLAKKMITGATKTNNHNGQQILHSSSALQNEIKIARTSFKIFIIFVITWSPTAILILMGINGHVPTPVYLYSVFLAHSNSMLNFFIYYIDNSLFRKGFCNLFRKVLKKNTVSNNIFDTQATRSSFKGQEK